MVNTKQWISRTERAAIATLLALNLSAAHALVVDATTTFDNASSFGPTSGAFSLTSGGVTTSATYAGSAASPTSALSGPLTQVFDGTGFDGAANANDAEFLVGFDTVITVFNDEASVQEVKFRLEYSNMVNADGEDAYAHSNLFLFDNVTPGDIFFSDLMSDTLFGDENGGVATGTSGDALMESGVMVFSYTLNPSDLLQLNMSWTLEGGEYMGGVGDLAEASLSANVTIVPLPGALVLMLSGMLLFPLQQLIRR